MYMSMHPIREKQVIYKATTYNIANASNNAIVALVAANIQALK